MNSPNTFNAPENKERPILLFICLFVSVLLHLLAVYLLQNQHREVELNLSQQDQQPTIVRLVDKPPVNRKLEYELDQKPALPEPQPPVKSSRLAEQNQRVKKEQAPKGDDTRDLQEQAAKLQPTPPVRSQPQQMPQKPAEPPPGPEPVDGSPAREKQGLRPPRSPDSLPSLEQLTQLTPSTMRRISSNEQATQERIRQRDDVDEGDTVWLNLERGLLISFFRRFRNRIEGVWNYPREAVEKELQGILLLKITVTKDGELVDVDLLKSSGHDILDYEAIQSVYRAAPFGPLGKHYPHPELKIMAHFRYQISGKYIYGKPR